ncbi:glycine/betaine ABC transporter substrate-binding protein [Dictyobacter vulcani]|uniref:Glycine/betaine ABC transporter substrate-binding protein n=1 Tax=Dictyobacter vulcani TaxID=2607529 RepID=A0A5J4KX13_9CHLR|nr:glycine betaine ABC transporter substrate-binding protein [Dictyobacter vulcani]GER92023.1 glycine/betaine ABC transporter substrate-binding protein [Dictyobacter vulcani]
MKKIVSVWIMLTALLTLVSGCGFGPQSSTLGNTPKSGNTIVIGSKNFSESIVLGNMMYDLLKAKLKHVNVQNQPNLASTLVAWTSVKDGQLDIYPEYTGTGLVDILKKPASTNTEQVYQTVKQEYARQYHVDWLDPIGFNNTYAVAVPKAIAHKYHLTKISDLAAVSSQLVFGGDPEFFIRHDDGFPALMSKYGLNFQSTRQIDVGLKYLAVASDQFQVTDAYSTDGALIRYNLVVLQDDKHLFPPYYAAPLVREDTLKAYPEIKPILNELSGKINNETMKQLNYQVDVQHKSADDVARQFLVSHGLLSS